MSITHSPVQTKKETIFPWSTLTWSYDGDIYPSGQNLIGWTAGDLNFSNDISYAVTSGSEVFSDTKYLYWDLASSGIFQFGSASDCIGNGIIPIGVGIENLESGQEASLRVFQGPGLNITADNIATNTLSAISANMGYLTAGVISGIEIYGSTITGGTIQTATSGQQVVIDGTDNSLKFYIEGSSNYVINIDSNIWEGSAGIKVRNASDVDQYINIIPGSVYINNTGSLGSGTNRTLTGYHRGRDDYDTYGIFGVGHDSSSQTYGRNRVGTYGFGYIALGSNSSNAIGVYGKATSLGTGLEIGVLAESNTIGLRIGYSTTPTNYCDFGVDTDGYLNITPTGDKLILWESGGAANDSTQMWTDTGGIFNLKPDGDKLRIWESAGGAGHYGDIYANTSGNLVINGGTGNVVYVDDNFNVSGTYSRAGTVIVDASRNCDFNNVNADGAFQIDGSDIISTSAQQTGSFITRTYVSFGRDANLTRTDPGSTTADAATVDGSTNLQGYRMIRAGVVTGVSGQFITSARADGDTITFTVQKNGVNQSMVATKTITGLGGTGCITTANSFSVVAEDTVNVEMTLTAGDVGTVTIANIAIAVEMLI